MSGALASPHAEATRAGLDAYAAGGTALDAALAAAAVLTVVYPHQCSLGGDLFALVAEPDGGVRSVNGSGAAAAALDVETLRARSAEMPDTGADPVTVPGTVAAWEALAGLGARLGLARALAPAIELAECGTAVSRSLAAGIRARLPLLREDEGMRATFLRDGEPLVEGEPIRQPALARSLAQLAREGAGALYGGSVGEALVTGLRRLGSPLTLADLAGHETLVEEPLALEHDGHVLLTAPPNSQGFVLLEMLAALGPEGLGEPGLCVQAALLGMDDRDAFLGDPRRSRPPLERLLDPSRAAARLRTRAGPPAAGVAAGGDTVAVVAIDDERRAVSLIQSVYQTFGACVLEPRTGIVCHNRGRGFSLRPGAPNEAAPGTRPMHTLMPLLVRRGGETVAALGTMGGRAQPQILLQVLPGALDLDRPLEQTLAAPRWIVGGRDLDFDESTVALEAHAQPGTEAALAEVGLPVVRIARFDERAGHAQVARCGRDGLEAASDPRSDGAAGRV